MRLSKYLRVLLVTIFLISLTVSPIQVVADNHGTTNTDTNLRDKVESIPVTPGEEPEVILPVSYTVKLASGWFTPSPGVQLNTSSIAAAGIDYAYCLIQFYHSNYSMDDYSRFKESGIKILSYVPENTYYAKVPLSCLENPPNFVRWMGILEAEQKIDPRVKQYVDSQSNEPIKITVLLFEPLTESQSGMVRQFSESVLGTGRGSTSIEVNPANITSIATLNNVKWIDEFQKEEICLDRSIQLISADRVWANGNSGSGVTVGIIDSGIQHNHNHFSDVTIYDAHDYVDGGDYPEAECGEADCSDYSNNDDDGGIDEGTHGVHVAGIVSGSSTYNGRTLNGVSNDANLVIERIFDEENDWKAPSATQEDIWGEILDPDGDGDFDEASSADIISNSWGRSNNTGDSDYDESSRIADRVVLGELGREAVVVMAAGNDAGTPGVDPDVAAPGTAKNVITVGACADFRDDDSSITRRYDTDGDGVYESSADVEYDDQNQYVMGYSSRGTDDGRIKPDILAPGSAITSSVIGNSYSSWDGTSMATPHVAAVAAQVLHEYPDATPALIKAFMVSSAVDGGTTDATSIDRAWGRLNAHSSIYKLPDEAVDSYDEDRVGNLLSGQPKERYYTINVPDDATKLIAALVYSDDPGDPSASDAEPKLVNDLDLFLKDTNDNELYRDDDALNNVEKYVIDNPTSGTWEAHVRAVELADLGGLLPKSQDYAIALTVIKETEQPSTVVQAHSNKLIENDEISAYYGETFEIWTEASSIGLSGCNVFCNLSWDSPGLALLSSEFDGSGEQYDLLGDIPVDSSRLSRRWEFRAANVGTYEVKIHLFGQRADGSEIDETVTLQVNIEITVPGEITFTATPDDGFVENYGGSWDTVRGASAGKTVYDDIGAATFAIRAARYISGNRHIARSFFSFPTAPLPDDCHITAVTLRLHSWTYSSSVSVQKGTQADTLTTASYNDFSGSEYGHTSWGAGYNNITFNAQGRADISKTGATKLCVREYDHDYLNSEPDGIFDNGCYFSEKLGEDVQPQLVVTYETCGPPTVTGNVTGEVRDVNANLLSNVEVSLYEHGGGLYASDVASSEYSIEIDQPGEYWLSASKSGFATVKTNNLPPYRNPYHPDYIDFTTPELLAAGYILDFEGDYGLAPRACTMSYAMESVSHWLFIPTGHPEWQLSGWKAMESVHSWQYPS